MAEGKKTPSGPVSQLGSAPEGRVQKYFCIDVEECRAFAKISEDAEVLRRISMRIRVIDEEVDGWIVELRVPATDGVVREDPMKSPGKI